MPTFATFSPRLPNTPSGPTLGGPSTDSTPAGVLLGSPGENVAKVGTILPLPCEPLCTNPSTFRGSTSLIKDDINYD